jgi:hypothetical protein
MSRRGAAACIALWLVGWTLGALAAPLACPPAATAHGTPPAPGPYRQGLLWQLRAPSGAVSHLFGTIHLGSPEVATPSAAVRAALQTSRSFGMEVLFDSDTLLAVGSSVIAPAGRSLAARAEPALRERTVSLLAAYGVDAEAAGRLKPWAAWTTLALPPGETGLPLDLVLMGEAEALGLARFGLETLAEQTALFDQLSAADELELLRAAVCLYEEQAVERASLVQAWRQQDLAALYAAGTAEDSPAGRRLLQRMLHQRNATMFERLLPQLAAGGAFVAVGALHLAGTDGLLARLAAAGYRVKAVE